VLPEPSRPALEFTEIHYVGTGLLTSGVKRPGYESDNSPSNARGKKECRPISSLTGLGFGTVPEV